MTLPRAFTAVQASAFRLRRQHLHPADTRPSRTARVSQVAHVTRVCADTAGIQAQVMSAAELAIWTRARGVTPDAIRQALWQDRAIVKTSAMRMTLHLLAADDLAMYVAAMKPSVSALLDRVFGRLRAKPADRDRVQRIVMDALADGPQTQQALIARASEGASRGKRAWLKFAWSAVRPLLVEGAVVYAPPRGGEVTFVRVDRWLPPTRPMALDEARRELLRRFLGAFGPATPQDFSKWTGMRVADAKAACASLQDDVTAVTIDGAPCWTLTGDLDALAASRLDGHAIRLLPAFDTLLLAHATKEHLVDRRYFPRVYRPQGWISPVVLQGERVIAVWFSKSAGGRMTIEVQPFARLNRRVRAAIDSEAAALGPFVGLRTEVRYSEDS